MDLDPGALVLMHGCPRWQKYPVRRLEDLRNLVLGAELEVIHMGCSTVRGSLAFAAHDGLIFSTSLLQSPTLVRGILSSDAMTFCLGLRLPLGARQWLDPVSHGDIGLLQSGAEYEGLFPSSSLHLALTLDRARLEREATLQGVVLDQRLSDTTGLHPDALPQSQILQFRSYILHLHEGDGSDDFPAIERFSKSFLRCLVHHYARRPEGWNIHQAPRGRACIVKRARDYIEANLAAPLSMDAVARAAETSRRTLFRSFEAVLGEGPLAHATRLRLHALRKDLLVHDSHRRIADLAGGVGFRTDAGRASARYGRLFGELPRDTRALRFERNVNWL